MSILLPTLNKIASYRNKFSRENLGYAEADHIGLISNITVSNQFEAILHLEKLLVDDNKEVETLMQTDEVDNPKEGLYFESQDFSFFGKWRKENVEDFVQQKFDFLIHIDAHLNPLIENILLCSQAKCRIGIYNEDHQHLFEMMIKHQDDANLKSRMVEIYKYLKLLQ